MSVINPALPGLWHGGDYNPEQWLHYPQVLEDDIRLIKQANCRVMSVGIFAWAALEPEEGRFEFGWLDALFDRFEAEGLSINLATPSGARPRWLAERYPEVLRVNAERRRQMFGTRHNHCLTSPAYRAKTARINTELVKRYGRRKALVMWHVSNEFSGDCHCDLCQQAFRRFLQERYGSLDELNHAWWTPFWSRTYTSWDQIESSSPIGEGGLNGLYIDWKRFVTAQTISFLKNETAPLREHAPAIPVTTNLMGYHPIEINLHELAKHLDISSWDAYPAWHAPEGDAETAQYTAMLHDLTRSFKPDRPFLLMECSPGASNWKSVAKQKRPGMHRLAGLLAIASGSDGVLYFQWRKGRGGCEKYCGAVVGHAGDGNDKTFRDVAELGATLQRIAPVAGSLVRAEVGIVGDWENWWGINDCNTLRRDKRDYWEFVRAHHRPFFEAGIATDIIPVDADFSRYRLIVAPMLYQVKPGVAERLEAFVAAGGTLVLTFFSGQTEENDLCFMADAPGPLRRLAGLRVEELDILFAEDPASLTMQAGNRLGFTGTFPVQAYCEVVHPEGAEVLATHDQGYYQGKPALTVNRFGAGSVYYLAANADATFHAAFCASLSRSLALPRACEGVLPPGVIARRRTGAEHDSLFLMNFTDRPQVVDLGALPRRDLESGVMTSGQMTLAAYGGRILGEARPGTAS